LERRWTIPADLERVGALVLEAADVLARNGVGAEPLYKAQLLLEEILTNVVRHGFRGDRSRLVQVAASLDRTGISLVVEDDAAPFDPVRDAPPPDLTSPLPERREGGLGLHLVKEVADEFAYERRGNVNRVRMRVRLAPAVA
jgi:anti-sigma regulatory factor (Ser/Thr protein kinase)